MTTREQWLQSATAELAELFKQHEATIPAKVRSTCGWPSRGGTARKSKTLGECWKAECSKGELAEIFISPVLAESMEVLAVLAHELIHAVVPDAKHGAPFKRIALAIGLEGKMTSTHAGEVFKQWGAPVIDRLGQYPHDELVPMQRAAKQTTRLIKCECMSCGYTVRTTQKWLDAAPPICPVCEDAPAMESF